MSATADDRATERRANDLYWTSDESVNQIAEELDLSKGTLYGLIRPLPTGLACPDCGEELLFANRTARERSMVSCALCGWEGEVDDSAPFGGDGGVTLPELSDSSASPAESRSFADSDPGRTRVMLGGALLGAAAGLALVFWSRRR